MVDAEQHHLAAVGATTATKAIFDVGETARKQAVSVIATSNRNNALAQRSDPSHKANPRQQQEAAVETTKPRATVKQEVEIDGDHVLQPQPNRFAAPYNCFNEPNSQ